MPRKKTEKATDAESLPSLFDEGSEHAAAQGQAPASRAAGAALLYEDGRVVPLGSERDHASSLEPAQAGEAQEAPEAQEADEQPAESAGAAGGSDEGDGGISEERAVEGAMNGDAEEDGALVLARYASQAYLEYAMSVVKSRALPEVSDGQKPVQRRILVDMDRLGIRADAKNVKSARIVGDVLGKYHPHGDQSVYDALVRMAQDFSMRYPLIADEGNFGSRDGDSQAAMRYTETRLMPISKLLLDELDKGAVDFVPNYDGNFMEPVELPAKLPFVLLNGASGIAVGMATEIPSHNLSEVAKACTLLLEKPEATLDEVMALLPAPDFPCGAQIISSRADLRQIYACGRGKIRVRARYHFEDLARGQWQLVVDELPPNASSKLILDQIEAVTNPKVKKDKKSLSAKQAAAKASMLAMLERVRDESGKEVPVRLVFEPKSRTIDRSAFATFLLAQTDMEANVPVNLVMLGIDGKPRQKSLLEIIREWLEFRMKTVRRRSQSRLDKVLERIHVLEGRQLILLNIDRAIEIIRQSDDPKAALIAEFKLSERQADDILEIRLRQLARLAAIEIEKEHAQLEKERAQLERVLGSDGALRRLVAKEIAEAAKEFGDARRTLVEEASEAVLEKSVSDEPVTVVISEKGFIRSRTGHGHDCTLMNFKIGDGLAEAIECRTVDTLTVVDSTGRVYAIAVSELPGSRGDGLPLSSFIDMPKGAEVVGWLAGDPKGDVLLATTDGMGLLCSKEDLSTRVKAGRLFVKVADGEHLLPPMPIAKGMTKVACLSAGGRLLIFGLDEIRRLSSGGKGVTLMQLEPGERLADIAVIDERGCLVSGIGRGKKPREAIVARKTLAFHTLRRARKGRQLAVTWKPLSVRALPAEGEAASTAAEDVDESSPSLL